MLKYTLTAAALAAMLATPAFAQQQPKTPMNPAMTQSQSAQPAPGSQTSAQVDTTTKQAGFVQNQSNDEWRASKLIGASVYGPDNKSIGDINDVIISQEGNIKAVVVGVGGFLGVGEKNVAIPFNSLNVQRKADSSTIAKISVSFSKNELKSAPKFAYYSASESTTGAGAGMKPSTNDTMTDHAKTMKK